MHQKALLEELIKACELPDEEKIRKKTAALKQGFKTIFRMFGNEAV